MGVGRAADTDFDGTCPHLAAIIGAVDSLDAPPSETQCPANNLIKMHATRPARLRRQQVVAAAWTRMDPLSSRIGPPRRDEHCRGQVADVWSRRRLQGEIAGMHMRCVASPDEQLGTEADQKGLLTLPCLNATKLGRDAV